ncbi:hypothetical protein CALVIDRAFT_122617 [Calocera viscosa TUFC12733]|uniref:AA1-like domain-containing protein n=1 Tax=Calocera viscosa (strain TUFC12733) TaxID=1330018 RepID=A0A167RMJ6_CALVF|nr:hypothetical protein CALVIDRAFT_122617 [Calocera viscosa TUFC12733]
MKFLAATLAVALVALPIAVKGQVLTFTTFNSDDCSGNAQEEENGSGPGDHLGNFGAPRYSFQIVQTDYQCDLTIYQGLDQGGESVTLWQDTPGDGTCSYTSPDDGYFSFSINCN